MDTMAVFVRYSDEIRNPAELSSIIEGVELRYEGVVACKARLATVAERTETITGGFVVTLRDLTIAEDTPTIHGPFPSEEAADWFLQGAMDTNPDAAGHISPLDPPLA